MNMFTSRTPHHMPPKKKIPQGNFPLCKHPTNDALLFGMTQQGPQSNEVNLIPQWTHVFCPSRIRKNGLSEKNEMCSRLRVTGALDTLHAARFVQHDSLQLYSYNSSCFVCHIIMIDCFHGLGVISEQNDHCWMISHLVRCPASLILWSEPLST